MMHLPSLRRLALGLTAAAVLAACQTPAVRTTGPLGEPVAPETPRDSVPVLTPEMAANAQMLTNMAVLQDRLYRVAAPLLINNAELCKSQARNLLGFTAKNRYSYPGEFNEAAHAAFGMGERLQVTGVLAGSGAARSACASATAWWQPPARRCRPARMHSPRPAPCSARSSRPRRPCP